jgi:cytochrome c-type biogenesis protein CcmH
VIKRLLLALAVLTTLGLAAAPVTAVEPDEVLDDPVLEARARDLSRILRCPVCQNESIDSSNAGLARDLRILVRERLVAGDSDQQALDFLVARYGDYILLQPPLKPRTYLLWFGPVIILLLGLGVVFRLWTRRRPAQAPSSLTPEERTRLDRLMDPAPLEDGERS